ncbi:MAG: hypothetical protein GY906_36130 [bacterium]|nr:hypothetical protein [bacterium]
MRKRLLTAVCCFVFGIYGCSADSPQSDAANQQDPAASADETATPVFDADFEAGTTEEWSGDGKDHAVEPEATPEHE